MTISGRVCSVPVISRLRWNSSRERVKPNSREVSTAGCMRGRVT
jgi:hypothetical protein